MREAVFHCTSWFRLRGLLASVQRRSLFERMVGSYAEGCLKEEIGPARCLRYWFTLLTDRYGNGLKSYIKKRGYVFRQLLISPLTSHIFLKMTTLIKQSTNIVMQVQKNDNDIIIEKLIFRVANFIKNENLICLRTKGAILLRSKTLTAINLNLVRRIQ